MIGYSVKLHKLNAQADDAGIGVRLGRVCLKKSIPVSEVAAALGVTRQTVYNWFCARTTPYPAAYARIESYIAHLG
jgi:transcriptional regulator with XRE-family HTH domain